MKASLLTTMNFEMNDVIDSNNDGESHDNEMIKTFQIASLWTKSFGGSINDGNEFDARNASNINSPDSTVVGRYDAMSSILSKIAKYIVT